MDLARFNKRIFSAALIGTAEPTDEKGSLRKVIFFPPGCAFSPQLERIRFDIQPHEFYDFAGSKIELDANCVESRAIFPRHLSDTVNVVCRKWNLWGGHYLTLVHVQRDRGFEFCSPFYLQHSALQNFISSQSVAHFFASETADHNGADFSANEVFSGTLSCAGF